MIIYIQLIIDFDMVFNKDDKCKKSLTVAIGNKTLGDAGPVLHYYSYF